MVENNEAFCLPHNFSYEGNTYNVRHCYPRLICCRHSGGNSGGGGPAAMASCTGERGEDSPANSPLRKPLLAHVQGAAVVSKIACPPGHAPLTCPSVSPGTGGGLRGMGPGSGEMGDLEGVVGGGAKVVIQQPAPTSAIGPLFPDLSSCSDGEMPLSADRARVAAGLQYHGQITSERSLTPSSLEKYLVTVSSGTTSNSDLPTMGDGQQGDCGDSTPSEGGATPSTPDSVIGQRPMFKLSDGSDFSDDYTAMTDISCPGENFGAGQDVREVVGDELEGDLGVINGSSVCSDVFSDDRSSDAGGTLEPDVIDVTNVNNVSLDDDVTSSQNGEDNNNNNNDEEEEDDETPRVFGRLSLDANINPDFPSPKRSLNPGQGPLVLDVRFDPSEESERPSVTSPEIKVDETFDLQRDDLNDVTTPSPESESPPGNGGGGGFYEDREFEFLKAQPVKRSTSLKTYKTPPGTPKRKMVRFADALGLDLESVRHILNLEAPPKVPQSAMKDLKLEKDEPEKLVPTTQGARYLTACFSQPGINPTFPLMVRDRKVILENCVINDHNLSVSGTVRVANLHFHKDVTVRYSTNNWLTFNDINAGYVHNSNDGPTDRFSFTISLPHYFSTGSSLQFCIRFTTGGEVYWDNNHGRNYVIECYARTMPDSDNTWMSFL